jgi:hypothetical protein
MRAGFDAGIDWVDSEELVAKAIRGRRAPTVEIGGVRFGSGVDPAGIRRGA